MLRRVIFQMRKTKTQLTRQNESNVVVIGSSESVASWTNHLSGSFSCQRKFYDISMNLVTLKPMTSRVTRAPKLDYNATGRFFILGNNVN